MDRSPLSARLRVIADLLAGKAADDVRLAASALSGREVVHEAEVLAELGRHLSPENENVKQAYVIAAIRDMAQIMVTSRDNAKEAMAQFDYRGRELEAANLHAKFIQGERDQCVTERDLERQRIWDAIIAIDAIEHVHSIENSGDMAERIERIGQEMTRLAADASREAHEDSRSCTCHPDDNPLVPCAKRFTLSNVVTFLTKEGFPDWAREIERVLSLRPSRPPQGGVPAPAQEINCPLCGVNVKQVASATLSLALWQHVNWTCKVAEDAAIGRWRSK